MGQRVRIINLKASKWNDIIQLITSATSAGQRRDTTVHTRYHGQGQRWEDFHNNALERACKYSDTHGTEGTNNQSKGLEMERYYSAYHQCDKCGTKKGYNCTYVISRSRTAMGRLS